MNYNQEQWVKAVIQGVLSQDYSNLEIVISDDCSNESMMIASHVSIYASSHVFAELAVPTNVQGLSVQGIENEQDVWVGAGVRILDGVRTGTGSIFAARAVITPSTKPYTINGGVPARKIGIRQIEGQLADSKQADHTDAGSSQA